MKFLPKLTSAILLLPILALTVVAQGARVDITKHSTAMPKSCEQLVPAGIADPIDTPALVKEALCKGSGDMLGEYTYVTHSIRREKDKKGKEKIETYTYEVFFPTLKSGTRARGILVVTNHNGIQVPADELEKVRARAAERTEKEEARIAREAPEPLPPPAMSLPGLLPLGTYPGMSINHETFGSKHSARLSVHTFLKTCELTLVRREQIEGRETLIFSFRPNPNAQFGDNEKYIAQLTGEVWIDAADRIVTRLAGWPSHPSPDAAGNAARDKGKAPIASASEQPPAVYVEMQRLSKQGIWLARVTRINGADYPKLFDEITTDSTHTNSDYIRFSTDIRDVQVGGPPQP